MRRTPHCTQEQASRTPRLIRRPALESTNPPTAAVTGRSLLPIPVFRLAQVLIATQYSARRLERLVSNQRRPIAGRLLTAVQSPLSLLTQATRILFTFPPTAAFAE